MTQVEAKLEQVEAKLGQKFNQVRTKLVPSWCQVESSWTGWSKMEVRRAKMGELGVQD